MNIDETTNILAKQFAVHVGMSPQVAMMAGRRYVSEYFKEKNISDLPRFEVPNFGKWVADKLKASGIVNPDRVEKLAADFNANKV